MSSDRQSTFLIGLELDLGTGVGMVGVAEVLLEQVGVVRGWDCLRGG